jgi:hypothetical protein
MRRTAFGLVGAFAAIVAALYSSSPFYRCSGLRQWQWTLAECSSSSRDLPMPLMPPHWQSGTILQNCAPPPNESLANQRYFESPPVAAMQDYGSRIEFGLV